MKIEWKDFLKIPNLLSLYRLILGLFFPFLWKKNFSIKILLGLIITAILSDTLDGNIARFFHQETDLGRILDPIADKVFINMLLILFYLNGYISAVFLFIILIRDLVIILGAIILYFKYHGQVKISPSYLGKACTVFQSGFIFLYFFNLFIEPLNQFFISLFMQLVIFFTIASGLHYGLIFYKSVIKSPIT